jgi:hypothetical protein
VVVIVIVLDSAGPANSRITRLIGMTTTPIIALNEGARRVLRVRKLIVLFYLMNLIAAVAIVAPAVVLIGEQLSHSVENDRMYSNLDAAWIIGILFHFQWWPLTGIGITLAIVAMLYLVLNTYLAGGAVALLHREGQPFFSSCARYFFRLIRLMSISLVFYGLVFLFDSAVNAAIARGRESSMESHTWIILHWIQLGILFLLVGVVNMTFDYAKIACIAGGERSALWATVAGIGFARRNFARALLVYWICSGIGLAFLLAYHGITEVIGQDSPIAVALVFVLRQLYVLVRMWLRLWTWSSELRLYTFSSTMVAPDPPSLAVAG